MALTFPATAEDRHCIGQRHSTFRQNETFFVDLGGPTNATLQTTRSGTILATMQHRDSLSVNDVSVVEGNAGTSIVTFNVALSPVSAQTVMVDFATANGTATTA